MWNVDKCRIDGVMIDDEERSVDDWDVVVNLGPMTLGHTLCNPNHVPTLLLLQLQVGVEDAKVELTQESIHVQLHLKSIRWSKIFLCEVVKTSAAYDSDLPGSGPIGSESVFGQIRIRSRTFGSKSLRLRLRIHWRIRIQIRTRIRAQHY